MRLGVIVPQGWRQEFAGREAPDAWAHAVSVAATAEQLGFDSLWVFDHFTTAPDPTPNITFEAFTMLSRLSAHTTRVELGQLVTCAGFRNAALTAKMISTLDVMSGGRAVLGIGAGWKEDEWRSYGYDFPSTKQRLEILADSLEVITRMLQPGEATFHGNHASVERAINEPKPIREPRLPIVVGGNGPNVTWRLAARHADELNVDGLSPEELERSIPLIRARCEEIDRDPDTLALSVHYWYGSAPDGRDRRVADLAAYRDLGVGRVMTFVRQSADSVDALEDLAQDALHAGVELTPR